MQTVLCFLAKTIVNFFYWIFKEVRIHKFDSVLQVLVLLFAFCIQGQSNVTKLQPLIKYRYAFILFWDLT